MSYIAHSARDGRIQSIKEHSESTERLATGFSVPALAPYIACAALLHDVGKYQPSFQKRIGGANIRVDHSVCGAQLCRAVYGNTPLSLLMQLCIAGHHAGLPDCVNSDNGKSALSDRIVKQTEDYGAYRGELSLQPLSDAAFNKLLTQSCGSKEELIERYAFFVRYCFSCLTDADSLDTAVFMTGKTERSLSADFERCLADVRARLDSFTAVTELQRARARLQAQVFAKLDAKGQVFLMNMPTGSGKTLCSMRFALERAVASGKKRIIYIIPYNSIIDQTAAELEQTLGAHAQILRHQSTFSFENDETLNEDERELYKFSCENWDAQIIITTAVQFFESIYGNRRAKLRKLHNMANSVLVFDEAHLMPIERLQPCLMAVAFITEYLASEAVFLTATMPDYRRLFSEYAAKSSSVVELITDKSDFAHFGKCSYSYIGKAENAELTALAQAYPSALFVVNSRRAARELFAGCSGKRYHLSTYMTPLDRERVIGEIKSELAALRAEYPCGGVPAERRLTVVSTSLIEAGVDLDFDIVFRELTGLDSILQAGGRCNREGLRKGARVIVYSRPDSQPDDLRTLITRGIIAEFDDISCDAAISAYYERLYYARRDEITKSSISQSCDSLKTIPFASYSLELIKSSAVSIVVPRDEKSRALVEKIRATGVAYPRLLQKYCASVYPQEFNALLSQHAINDFGSGVYCLVNPDYYDDELGLSTEGRDYII